MNRTIEFQELIVSLVETNHLDSHNFQHEKLPSTFLIKANNVVSNLNYLTMIYLLMILYIIIVSTARII